MTLKDNKKYQAILQTSQDLFFAHGTKRVTIEEICEKSNVSKMTFYKFFKNKDELAMEVLQEFFDKGIKEYNEIMQQDVPFIEKVKKTIQFKIETTKKYSDTFFTELLETNEVLRSFAMQKSIEYKELTLQFYRQGQQEGAIRKDIDLNFLLSLSDHIMEMFKSESLKAVIPDIHDRYNEILNFFFYGVLERNILPNTKNKGDSK